jgi:ATP/maltotriose-dependent transcriptional regulator MalT/DNA-binding SARP family transcriptional activator
MAQLPLAALVAGPGYGKTSTLAGWARRQSRPLAWYSVAREEDLYGFLAHLTAALHGALGPESLRPASRLLARGGRWAGVVDLLLNALLEQERGVLLVLDDVHQLSAQARPALARLCEGLPPSGHILLASRSRPDLPGWSGWVARGRAAQLAARDLALDASEVEALLALRRQERPTPGQVRQVLEQSGGWPLAADFLARTGGSAPLARPPELEGYIAREVWEPLSPEGQEQLLRLGVLDNLTTAEARELAGPQAPLLLADMAARGLLVADLGQGRYRLHQLLVDFLRGRLETHPQLRSQAHRAAAGLLAHQPLEAAGHLAAAGERDGAARLLAREAAPLLERGQAGRLLAALSRLGLENHPDLALARARALAQTGSFPAALAACDQAGSQARQRGDLEGERLALLAAARIYVDTLQPRKASALLRRVFRLTSPERPEERAAILDLLAENCLNQGRATQALRFRRWSRSLLASPGRDTLDARLLLRTGRLAAARALLLGRLEARRPADRPPEAHREEVLVLSYLAALQGDAEAAERWARAGLELARKGESLFTEAVAWMRLGHALQLRGAGEEAIACYGRSLALAEQAGVERLRVEALMGLALLHAHQGDIPRSYACATEGLAISRSAGDDWLAAWLTLAAGISARLGGHPDASSLLSQARGRLEECRDGFGACTAALWLEDPEAPARARERGYEFLLDRPTLFGPPPPPAPPPPQLRVQCLGPFRLWRCGQEVDPRAWKRRKARELFLLLLTRRNAACHREELMEALWPEASPRAAERDFRVALHALSEVLDPDRPARALARWVERQDQAYLLRTGGELEVDAEEFEGLLARARQAPPQEASRLRRRALSLYGGDFLADHPYLEWCGAERERLRQLYLAEAQKEARAALEAQDEQAALDLAQAILERDPCWEEAYRLLMEVHLRAGRPYLAARTYERCRKVLQQELGLSPSAAVERLYERALAGA